jgi:exopolysaccharide biosynthesis polyprenyl glycosylphosphotransferase
MQRPLAETSEPISVATPIQTAPRPDPRAAPAPAGLSPGPGPRRETRAHGRGRLFRQALVVADVVGLGFAFAIAQVVFGSSGAVQPWVEVALFLATLPVWGLLARMYRLYEYDEERTDHSTVDDLVGVFHLVTIGVWTFGLAIWLAVASPNFAKLAAFWALAIALVTVARAGARAVCRTRPSFVQNVAVVGSGAVGQLVARKFLQHPEYGANVVGFADADPLPLRAGLEDVPYLGSPEQLPALVPKLGVDRVVVAFSGDSHERSLSLIRSLDRLDVQVDVVPRFFEIVAPNAAMHTVEGLPLIGVRSTRISPAALAAKRALDLLGAAACLLVCAPLFALLAVLVRLDSPGPALFRQTRLGGGMRPFTMLKFRTMRTGTDDAPHKEYIRSVAHPETVPANNGLYKLERPGDVTAVGKWLRKTSLDELPQLLNVVRGDMSLVGPRPCIPYEVEHFAPHHFARFEVPSGITGLWQVTARSRTTFAEALDLDVQYARGWTLGLDVLLLLRTARQLVRLRAAA